MTYLFFFICLFVLRCVHYSANVCVNSCTSSSARSRWYCSACSGACGGASAPCTAAALVEGRRSSKCNATDGGVTRPPCRLVVSRAHTHPQLLRHPHRLPHLSKTREGETPLQSVFSYTSLHPEVLQLMSFESYISDF